MSSHQTCYTTAKLRELAEKADLPIEKFFNAIDVIDQDRADQFAENRSSPDQRAAVNKYLADLDGNISPSLSVDDLLTQAGLPITTGTKRYASKQIKQALLAHQPTTPTKE